MQTPPSLINEDYNDLLEKLVALRLPSLKGKRFLEINCNDGFFCGYAAFQGASQVVGIDSSARAIELARTNFPDCAFIHGSWEALPDHSFDVVLLAFASYQTKGISTLIKQLTGKLAVDGTLIIEIGIVDTAGNFVVVKDGDNKFILPSWTAIGNLLDRYAWKNIGHRAFLQEQQIEQHVIHISNMKPYAFLLLEPPASGKSTLRRVAIKKQGVRTVSGDQVLLDIFNKTIHTAPRLEELVKQHFISTSIAKLTRIIFDNGLGPNLIHTWCEQAGYHHFVLDSYLHKKFHQPLVNHLKNMGYIPVTISWSLDSVIALPKHAFAATESYRVHLQRILSIEDSEKLPALENRSREASDQQSSDRFFPLLKKAIARINR